MSLRPSIFISGDGILGRVRIRAADASRTQILGNLQFDYTGNPIDCEGHPWYARMFMKPHIEIESDPKCLGSSGIANPVETP